MLNLTNRICPFLLLLFLGGGLSLAICGAGPTLPPFRQISTLSYATMSPYQTFNKENTAITADGLQKDGLWIPISLEPYLPLPQGEQWAWMGFVSSVLWRSLPPEDSRMLGYRRVAELLQLQEGKKGNHFSTIRLLLETWPVSPEGYLALRHPPFIQRTFIVQTP